MSAYHSISKPFSFLLQIPNRVTMKCMAVELKGSQWAFYLVMGLLAIFFCIVNVLWFNTTGGGMGMLISMVFCPIVLCYLAFDSFRQYRKATVTELSDGEVRAVCIKGLSGGTYAIEVDEGED